MILLAYQKIAEQSVAVINEFNRTVCYIADLSRDIAGAFEAVQPDKGIDYGYLIRLQKIHDLNMSIENIDTAISIGKLLISQ